MSEKLTYKYILRFWAPLAATWLMMSIEGPFLSAVIARMAQPKFNLAAYGVAFSFALIIEAPVIMIMSASTALVRSRMSFIKLRNFTYAMNISATLMMLILLIHPIFDFITIKLINLDEDVARLTRIAVFLLIPWPGSIGYRRFYQGILISGGETRKVAYGTIIRLISMASAAVILYMNFKIPGVALGASSLSIGVIMEASASRIMANKVLKRIKETEAAESEILDYRGIFNFYYPLAMTSILGLGVHPMVTFFIGQSRMSLESLAVLPVVNSLVFIFRSVGLSYQEAVIALAGKNNEGIPKLRNFFFISASASALLLGLVAYTPLSNIWFISVSGLGESLAAFAITPVKILFLFPALTFYISFQRSVLVHSRNTSPITYGTAIEVIGIIAVLFIGISVFDAVGIIAAAAAYIIGRIGANIYLTPPTLKAMKN